MNLLHFIHGSKDITLTLLIALFALASESFLLFHVAAEGTTIVIGIILFVKACKTMKDCRNSFTLLIGYALLFVGFIDFLHVITYSGMGVPIRDSANKSTQLWLAGRYILSFSFFFAPFFLTRRCPTYYFQIIYSLVLAIMLLAISFFKTLPACLTDEGKLTEFKIYNEFIVIAVLLFALLHLYRKRQIIVRNSFIGIEAAMAIFIFSEACFTLYIQVYSVINILGHILKVLAYGFVYYGIVSEPKMLQREKFKIFQKNPNRKHIVLRGYYRSYKIKRENRGDNNK